MFDEQGVLIGSDSTSPGVLPASSSSASTSSIHLSLDEIANFATPMNLLPGASGSDLSSYGGAGSAEGGSIVAGGSQASFDSFLSGADALDISSETTNGTVVSSAASGVSLPEIRSESGTPSLPDDGEFPCPQCDKKFGNRRNLTSHMRRHTGDYKLFCDDCGKGFFTQSKMDSHKRKHTGK